MSTTIHLARTAPFTTSDSLRDDLPLWNVGQKVATFLDPRDIETVTVAQLKTFLAANYADVSVVRAEKAYQWLYIKEEDLWVLECYDLQVLGFSDGDGTAVELRFDVRARYV